MPPTSSNVPTPGSPEAVAAGCPCVPLPPANFVVSADCPLHGRPAWKAGARIYRSVADLDAGRGRLLSEIVAERDEKATREAAVGEDSKHE